MPIPPRSRSAGSEPVAQRGDERVGDLGAVPAAAGRHLREPDERASPRTTSSRQRLAQPAGVAAQQPHGCAPRASSASTSTSRLAPTPVVRP